MNLNTHITIEEKIQAGLIKLQCLDEGVDVGLAAEQILKELQKHKVNNQEFSNDRVISFIVENGRRHERERSLMNIVKAHVAQDNVLLTVLKSYLQTECKEYCNIETFFEFLDAMELGLLDKQKATIAQPYLTTNGFVDYKKFLSDIDPNKPNSSVTKFTSNINRISHSVIANLKDMVREARDNGLPMVEVFEYFDVDGDGKISKEEFITCLPSIGLNSKDPGVAEEVSNLFNVNPCLRMTQLLQIIDGKQPTHEEFTPNEIPFYSVKKFGPFVAGLSTLEHNQRELPKEEEKYTEESVYSQSTASTKLKSKRKSKMQATKKTRSIVRSIKASALEEEKPKESESMCIDLLVESLTSLTLKIHSDGCFRPKVERAKLITQCLAIQSNIVKRLENATISNSIKYIEKISLAHWYQKASQNKKAMAIASDILNQIKQLDGYRYSATLRFDTQQPDFHDFRSAMMANGNVNLKAASVFLQNLSDTNTCFYKCITDIVNRLTSSTHVSGSWKQLFSEHMLNLGSFESALCFLQLGFTQDELISFRALFNKALGEQEKFCAGSEQLASVVAVDPYIKLMVENMDSFVSSLHTFADYSWGDFLCLIRRHILEMPPQLMEATCLEMQATSSILDGEDSRKCNKWIREALDLRKSVLGNNIQTHSMLIYSQRVVAIKYSAKAAEEMARHKRTIEQGINEFIDSPKGRELVNKLALGIMDSNLKPKLRVTHARATTIANDMIRKKMLFEASASNSKVIEYQGESASNWKRVHRVVGSTYGVESNESLEWRFDQWSCLILHKDTIGAATVANEILDIYLARAMPNAAVDAALAIARVMPHLRGVDGVGRKLISMVMESKTFRMSAAERNILWKQICTYFESSSNHDELLEVSASIKSGVCDQSEPAINGYYCLAKRLFKLKCDSEAIRIIDVIVKILQYCTMTPALKLLRVEVSKLKR